jgi:hypothetical protein
MKTCCSYMLNLLALTVTTVAFTSNLACPTRGDWGGQGYYCLQDSIYRCAQPGSVQPELVMGCTYGCQDKANTGVCNSPPNAVGSLRASKSTRLVASKLTQRVGAVGSLRASKLTQRVAAVGSLRASKSTRLVASKLTLRVARACPSGRRHWFGDGAYCLDGDLYHCQSEGQTNPDLQKSCASGCGPHPAGNDYADVCKIDSSAKFNSLTCPSGSNWFGNGGYCLDGDIYNCQTEGQASPNVKTSCTSGCGPHPDGPEYEDECTDNGSGTLTTTPSPSTRVCPSGNNWLGRATLYCLSDGEDLHFCENPGQGDPYVGRRCDYGCKKTSSGNHICRSNANTSPPTSPPTPSPTPAPTPQVPTCPQRLLWLGAGEYCILGDIWTCEEAGASPVEVVTECLTGCSVASGRCHEDRSRDRAF